MALPTTISGAAEQVSSIIPALQEESLISASQQLVTGPCREFIVDAAASPLNPVHLAAQALESMHLLTGTAWPVSIALFTLGIRGLLFPATVLQTRSSVMANNLKPQVDRMRSDSMALNSGGDKAGAKAKMAQLSAFMKEHRIGVGRLFGLGLLPVPFFMSTFFALQRMAAQPLPSFLDGGCAWFTDLAASDPYYILPVATTLTLLLSSQVRNIRRV